jgi:acetylornithine deacetylase
MIKKDSALDLMALAKKLIAIASVTGQEADLADFLKSYLSGLGFEVTEQVVEGRRRNILATAAPSPRVILCTHQDTVPPFLPPAEDEEYLYGRGACDAKGIMAVLIQAVLDMDPSPRAACGLLFLVGEETDSRGADRSNTLDVKSDFIVVGEPTENKLGLGHKGYIIVRLSARGKKAHSGYPHLGESAVLKLIDALERLRGLEIGHDPLLGDSTINIGRVEGGLAANVVPDSAWAEISIRNTLPSREALERIRAAVSGLVEVEVLTASEPQRLYTLPGFETAVLSFGTDIPHLRAFGRPLLFGPGSILDAHTDRERMSKAQMREAVSLYQKLVAGLLAGPGTGVRS